MATHTERILLGSNVTNSVTRDPTVTAGAAATIVEATPDRFVLGIGVGDSFVRIMGKRPSRIAELRTYIEDARTLLRGGTLTRPDGEEYRLIGQPKSEVPIYMTSAVGGTTDLA